MKYNIIDKRGVLDTGTPFILDENKALTLTFENLPDKNFYVVLSQANGVKRICRKLEGKNFVVKASELCPGIFNVELYIIEGAEAKDKIICTPILIQKITAESKGLIAYPEIDSVLARLAELEKILAELIEWKEEVSPKIHQHEILL